MASLFTAPNISTNTSTLTSINGNFNLINNAFKNIQNILPGITTQIYGSNLTLVDYATMDDGIIGTDSFIPSFNSDDELVITHGTSYGKSACVIQNRWHDTNSVWSKALNDVVVDDGTFTVNFGVRSRGAPAIEMLLEIAGTDNEQELTIYSFTVYRNSGSYTVSNLRLECPVIISKDSFAKAFQPDIPLTYTYQGVLPANIGRLPTGILIPWDCSVEGAYMRLETLPNKYTDQNTLEIELFDTIETDATNILADSATWNERETPRQVKTLTALTPAKLLSAGTFVYPNITVAENAITDYPATASDLTITLLVKRIYHDIM